MICSRRLSSIGWDPPRNDEPSPDCRKMPGDRWFGEGGVGSEDRDFSALPSRHIAGGSGDTGVALGTGKLPLQGRNSLDQLRGLGRTVTSANGDLDEHISPHELTYSLVCRLEGPSKELRRGGNGEHRRCRKRLNEQTRRRVAADGSQPLMPGVLKSAHSLLKSDGVLHRTAIQRVNPA